jgi:hypothetical protein
MKRLALLAAVLVTCASAVLPAAEDAAGATGKAAPARAPVPPWFTALPPNKWTPTAMGTAGSAPWQQGAMIADVRRPCPYGAKANFQDLSRAWNGACVNPDDNELLLVLNGGHAARQSNDAWALSLGTNRPAWSLIADPTPVYANDTDSTRTPYIDAYTSPA